MVSWCETKSFDQEFTADLEAGYYTAEVTLPTVTTSTTVRDDQQIEAEIAAIPEQRQLGLTSRRSLAPNGGMLYTFPNDGIFDFSTQGMNFPLDIIWMDSSKTVTFVSPNAPVCPNSETQWPNLRGLYASPLRPGS